MRVEEKGSESRGRKERGGRWREGGGGGRREVEEERRGEGTHTKKTEGERKTKIAVLLTQEAVLAFGTEDLRDEADGTRREPVVVVLRAVGHGGEHEELPFPWLIGDDRVTCANGCGWVMFAPPVVACLGNG